MCRRGRSLCIDGVISGKSFRNVSIEIMRTAKVDKTVSYVKQICLLFSLLCLSGCTETNSDGTLSETPFEAVDLSNVAEQPTEERQQDYVLQVNDSLDIKFPYESQLNELVTIRPDGKISLQLIDEINAAGLTSAQLDEALSKRYSRVLYKPEITVIVREFTGQQIYIGGEVKEPGTVALKGKMTVLEAIFIAGGFSETAEPKSVIVISRSANNTRSVRQVDIGKVLAGTTGEQELLVRPYDVIYIPKTAVAEVNKFVDQYIRKMIPINLNAGFSYTVFKEKQP